MKSCYRSLKQLDFQKELYSGLFIVEWVPQRSIIGSLLFLICVNDMPQTVSSTLLLYADDSCILYQHRKLGEIEKQQNKDSENICDWFMH